MKARIVTRSEKDQKRIIAISDIHGDLDALKRLLDKISFGDDDLLCLMGDYIERGHECLELVRFLIQLDKKDNVVILQGNCENLIEDVFEPVFRKNIAEYLKRNTSNIVYEMARYDNDPDLNKIRKTINEEYSDIRSWLNSLPHLLITEDFVFVHSGIKGDDPFSQDSEDCVKISPDFYTDTTTFDHTLIVGHNPVRNIRNIRDDSILFDKDRNIYFIDGGVGTVDGASLNALIIETKNNNIYFSSVRATDQDYRYEKSFY